jgi:hypothetical protein
MQQIVASIIMGYSYIDIGCTNMASRSTVGSSMNNIMTL